MRNYELVFIVHPELDENGFNDIVERVQGWVTENGGEVQKTDIWGRREMAYPIRKLREGQYVLMDVEMDPESGIVLERNLRFTEPILRFLLVNKEE